MLCALTSYAEPYIQGFDRISHQKNGWELEWNIPSLEWQTLNLHNKITYLPILGELAHLQEPGSPQVPTAVACLEIPTGFIPVLHVLDSLFVEEHCPLICPAPTVQTRESFNGNEGDAIYNFGEVYFADEFFPNSFIRLDLFNQSGSRFCIVTLFPLLVSPKKAILHRLVYLRLKIELQSEIISVSESPHLQHKLNDVGFQDIEWEPPQTAMKLFSIEEGIYRVTSEELAVAGADISSINPATLRLFFDGQELPCFVDSHSSQILQNGDHIIYYAPRLSGPGGEFYHPTSDTAAIWLTWGAESGKRYQPELGVDSDKVSYFFTDTLHFERDLFYYSGDSDEQIQQTALVPGEGWWWLKVDQGQRVAVDLSLPGFIWTTDSIQIRVRLRGTTFSPSTPDHHIRLRVNGVQVIDSYFDDRQEWMPWISLSPQTLIAEKNAIEVESINDLGAERSQFNLDWIEIVYPRRFQAVNGQLRAHCFADENVMLDGFNDAHIRAWLPEQGKWIAPLEKVAGKQLNVVVVSGGLNDGNCADFYIDGLKIFSGQRGFSLLVLNHENGVVETMRHFDTWGQSTQVDSITGLIESLPPGKVVLAAIRDEGSANLNERFYQAFESLGSGKIRQISYRDSWAFIGHKGLKAGEAFEQLQPRFQGQAIINKMLTIPNTTENFMALFPAFKNESIVWFADSSRLKSPLRISKYAPSHLRSKSNRADYIILTHQLFEEAADRLAEYRQQKNGFRCHVVNIREIYDEFNAGLAEPEAIKNFLRYAVNNWQPPAPRFLCLLGDASWDPKKHQGDRHDFIPSYGNPVSDVWFACLDGENDLLPDLHVGRIAVENLAQANDVIDKIIQYENSEGALWKKSFIFITGGFNEFEQKNFSQQSLLISQNHVQVAPVFGHTTIINKFTEGLIEGEKREEILTALNAGSVWTNFIGHAGSYTWDLMLHNPDIDDLVNAPAYPFITSMTCHTGRFAEPAQNSFGEAFIRAPQKGAIAFLGSSGWGYSYEDFLYLRKIYPSVLQDTVRVLGQAVDEAKVDLLKGNGLSHPIRNMIWQYNLLGDPALQLALPSQPDLAVSVGDVNLQPLSPSEADSQAIVSVRVQNWGLSTRDSVEISLSVFSEKNEQKKVIFQKVPSIGLTQDVEFILPLAGMVGALQLVIEVDPFGRIVEYSDSNNIAVLPINILSSDVLAISPPFSALFPVSDLSFKVQNPEVTKSQTRELIFEIDTTTTFEKPVVRSSPIVPKGFLSHWKASDEIKPGKHYYWRVLDRSEGQSYPSSIWPFTTSTSDFGWQLMPTGRMEASLKDFVWHNDTLQVKLEPLAILVQSAGLNDGPFAVLSLNGELVMHCGRGYNLAAIDVSTGAILRAQRFDTYIDADASEQMSEFIDELPDRTMVLAAISDEGSRNVSENALQALEKLGSRYCRQIGFRDSWAMIGTKGAAIGSVLELWRTAGTGAVVLRDTLNLYRAHSSLKSEKIGPARHWRNLSLNGTFPNGFSMTGVLLGWDHSDTYADTLLTWYESIKNIDLFQVNANKVPFLQLVLDFDLLDRRSAAKLTECKVLYDPVADLALSPKYYTFSKDTVLVGEQCFIETKIFNVGLSRVDSLQIKFTAITPQLGEKEFASVPLHMPVPVDSCLLLTTPWLAPLQEGNYMLTANVDPNNRITELKENNNIVSRRMIVVADESAPAIEVTFDGEVLQNGAWVSRLPQIIAKISDNHRDAIRDTTAIQVVLDGNRVYFIQKEILRLVPQENEQVRACLEFTPTLKDGNHILEFFITDLSNNRTYHRSDFQVISELKLLNVLNYPNPFATKTSIVFDLTQSAEVRLRIFTVAGRLIRSLPAQFLSPGLNMIEWDGCDEDGDSIANGVYLFSLTATCSDQLVEFIGKAVRMQ